MVGLVEAAKCDLQILLRHFLINSGESRPSFTNYLSSIIASIHFWENTIPHRLLHTKCVYIVVCNNQVWNKHCLLLNSGESVRQPLNCFYRKVYKLFIFYDGKIMQAFIFFKMWLHAVVAHKMCIYCSGKKKKKCILLCTTIRCEINTAVHFL